MPNIKGMGIAAITLATVISSTSNAGLVDTQMLGVGVGGGYYGPDSSYSGLIQAVYGSSSGWLGWGYDPNYRTYQADASQLQEVTLTVRIQLDGVNAPTTFGSRIALFTGWNPSAYQFYAQFQNLTTDADGRWTHTWRFVGASAAAWANPPFGPNGHFYGEVFKQDGGFSGSVTAELAFVTVPAPGIAVTTSVVALAFPRRRRER